MQCTTPLVRAINTIDGLYKMHRRGEVSWCEALEQIVAMGASEVTEEGFSLAGIYWPSKATTKLR